MDQSLRKFIEGMPKTELHLHIEGSLEPEMVFALAKRNHVELLKKDKTPYKDAAELKEAYKFKDLGEFLGLYYQGMSVLKTEQDFYDLTTAYLRKIASQNVTHTEIFFDPQGHTERGVEFSTVINGIHRALVDGEKEFGISSKLIMSFLRDKSEADAFKTLEQAKPYLDIIDGFGLDSYETPHPPEKFKRLYAELGKITDQKTGAPKKKLMHAGEEGPPAYVHQALDCGVDRIDHGNRSLEDPALAEKLVHANIGLTVCPLSNLRLGGIKDDKGARVDDMTRHPLKRMLDLGLKATVNSDDPAYFRTDKGEGGYMNENFIAVAEALDLNRADIIQLARNAIEVSFLSPEQKGEKTRELDEYIKANIVGQYVNPDVGKKRAHG